MKKIISILIIYCSLNFAQGIKISNLPELVYPDSADKLVIVDASSDTTKFITKYNLVLALLQRIVQLEDSLKQLQIKNNALFDSIQVLRNLIGFSHPVNGIFVDSNNGNDDSSGYSEIAAIRTLDKLNNLNFDTILTRKIFLKKNSVFVERLIPNHDSLTYSSYGIGNKPIITQKQKLIDTWTRVNDSIWRSDTKYFVRPVMRLWLNGIEQLPGISINGNNLDGTYGVCFSHKFYHNYNDNNSIYLYSFIDPLSAYDSIELSGDFQNTYYHTVHIDGVNYITLDNLDLQGGTYSSLSFTNSSFDTVKNCNIGKYSNWTGLSGNYYYTKAGLCNGIIIDGNNIISSWDYKLKFYTAWLPMGIFVDGPSSNWIIKNNYIENWWFGIYLHQNDEGYSIYHDVYNNEITSPLFTGGKGIQTHAYLNPDYGFNQYAYIYNNFIHNIPAAGVNIGSRHNRFYYNIIDSIFSGSNEHVIGNNGLGIEMMSEDPANNLDSNYIFNNTIYKTDYEQLLYLNRGFVYNNLFLEMRQAAVQHRTVYQYALNNCHYKNNLFYKTGSDSGSYFIHFTIHSPNDLYSVNMFNALGGDVSGNIYPEGFSTYQIINYNFTLPISSPAKNTGINITSLIPIGFKDQMGNLVDRVNPNLGGIDN